MLHNDNFNRREYVVQVLMKVIPGMTVDDAVNVMQARTFPHLYLRLHHHSFMCYGLAWLP